LYGGCIQPGLSYDSIPAIDLVANMACPIMGIFGNDDKPPSPAVVAVLGLALTNAAVDYEFHQYKGAGHGY